MPLDRVLSDVYGVGLLSADPTTILWALARVSEESGAEVALSEYQRANEVRGQKGAPLVYTPWGWTRF